MKIQINFDLLSKIKEANTGISLKRTANKLLFSTLFITGLSMPTIMNSSNSAIDQFNNFLIILFAQIIYTGKSNKLFAEKYKEIANNELNEILCLIKKLNISINYKSLLKSYTYDTEYEEYFDKSKIPKIIQKKYFAIPTDEEKEILLIQEHIIGTNTYDISCGSKTKKLNLIPQTT